MKSVFKKFHEKGDNDPEQVPDDDIKYQCPMKCEGEKVYNEPGRCPVCKMYLAPVKKS